MKDSRLLNEGDERGRTPLHLASAGGHTKVVQLLLRKGALFHWYALLESIRSGIKHFVIELYNRMYFNVFAEVEN